MDLGTTLPAMKVDMMITCKIAKKLNMMIMSKTWTMTARLMMMYVLRMTMGSKMVGRREEKLNCIAHNCLLQALCPSL